MEKLTARKISKKIYEQGLSKEQHKQLLVDNGIIKKKLEFTEHEQKIVTNSIMAISEILLLKMDEGVEMPTLEGNMDVDNENKELSFSFIAKKKN